MFDFEQRVSKLLACLVATEELAEMISVVEKLAQIPGVEYVLEDFWSYEESPVKRIWIAAMRFLLAGRRNALDYVCKRTNSSQLTSYEEDRQRRNPQSILSSALRAMMLIEAMKDNRLMDLQDEAVVSESIFSVRPIVIFIPRIWAIAREDGTLADQAHQIMNRWQVVRRRDDLHFDLQDGTTRMICPVWHRRIRVASP